MAGGVTEQEAGTPRYMAAPGQSSSMKIVLSYIRDRTCSVPSTFLSISSRFTKLCLQQFQDAHPRAVLGLRGKVLVAGGLQGWLL